MSAMILSLEQTRMAFRLEVQLSLMTSVTLAIMLNINKLKHYETLALMVAQAVERWHSVRV